MTNYDLASILAKNNVGEQEAIEGYLQLLTIPHLPKELADDIREIIADEMNHSMLLSKWMTNLTNIQMAKD